MVPPVAERWPALYQLSSVSQPVLSSSGSKTFWKTANYELYPVGSVDPETIEGLAQICETIDGAIRSAPLPLNWGRPPEESRVIHLYANDQDYLEAGGKDYFGGHYNPRTNEVHIRVSKLRETDTRRQIGQFSLEKRQSYKLLVHELIHQYSICLIWWLQLRHLLQHENRRAR